MAGKERKLGIWGKFLTLWVALCIGAGVGLGHLFPQLSDMLARLEMADVSIPNAILLFAMIYPSMVQISWGGDYKSSSLPQADRAHPDCQLGDKTFHHGFLRLAILERYFRQVP